MSSVKKSAARRSADRPCQHLMLAGLPGSGKETLQKWLCAVLADQGVPWGPLRAWTFHSDTARERIAAGELITDGRYWTSYVRRLGEHLTRVNESHPNAHVVFNALATKRSLRNSFVGLGKDESGHSDYYVVWLHASREKLVERLTRERSDTGRRVNFSPEWLERFYDTVEFPKAIEEAAPGKRLLRTEETNVFLLNADDEAVGRKGNYLCAEHGGVPGMHNFRVRMRPSDN